MVLFAEDSQKMSTLIQNLEKYTEKWGLTVNLEKTKLVLFRNSRTDISTFDTNYYFNGSQINFVNEYNYLGILLHYTGTWKTHINSARTKGLRAAFALKDKMKNMAPYIPTKTKVELFKTCVQTCALYGCEIWSTTNIASLENIQVNYAKSILGIRQRTPNAGALSELGLLPFK